MPSVQELQDDLRQFEGAKSTGKKANLERRLAEYRSVAAQAAMSAQGAQDATDLDQFPAKRPGRPGSPMSDATALART